MSSKIQLSCFGIVVTLTGAGGGAITSDLHEESGDPPSDAAYNTGIDAIESLILGHACAGVDVMSSAYAEGIETAVQALVNNV